MGVHIGKVIKKLAESNGKTAKELAKLLSTSVSNVYDIYRRESIDIDKLSILSEYFKFNLFQYYLDREPLKTMFGDEIRKLKEEIIQLKKKLAEKDETISDKKNIITFLEEKLSSYETAKSRHKVKGKPEK